VYTQAGNYTTALQFNQKALALAQQLKDGERSASAFASAGQDSYLLGDFDSARDSFAKSGELWQTAGNKSGIASSDTWLGNVALAQSNYAQALDYYRRALVIRQDLGDSESTGYLLCGVADAQAGGRDFDASLDSARKAVEVAGETGDDSLRWYALYLQGNADLGLVVSGLGDVKGVGSLAAVQSYGQAIALVESLRGRPAFFGLQPKPPISMAAPYLGMVAALSRQNRAEEAVSYAERAKMQQMLDLIGSGPAAVAKGLSIIEQQDERKLANSLASAENRYYIEKRRPASGANRLAPLSAAVKKAGSDYDEFEARLYQRHPKLRAYRGLVATDLPRAAKGILSRASEKAALVEYAVTRERTYVFVISRQSAPLDKTSNKNDAVGGVTIAQFTIETPVEALAQRVLQFWRMVAADNSKLDDAARGLYDLLLAPAKQVLDGKTSLVIVPDGPLWKLPFQA
ncbi:MAG: tetratricopeptide repeat protein, partial [Blastocatellia bacterium]